MGGALILLSLLVPTVLWAEPTNTFVLATMAVTAGYGVIGYLDDYLKIKPQVGRSPGRYKLFWQVVDRRRRHGLPLPSKSNLPEDWLETRDNLSVPVLGLLQAPDRAAASASTSRSRCS